MKLKSLLLAVLGSLFYCSTAFAQCDPTFTVIPLGNGQYEFQANYVPQTGYTYSDYWNLGMYGTDNSSAMVFENFFITGTFPICHTLTIQDSLGVTVCLDSSCQNVQVTVPAPCIAQFEADGYITSGTTVGFSSNIADYTNLQLVWQFGDGTTVTGVASPTHTFPGYGYFTYCLYATDTVHQCVDSSCGGIDLEACTQYGSVYYYQPSFSADSLAFYESGFQGSGVVYNWNFGDGSPAVINNSDSMGHTFPSTGAYTVTVIDSNQTNGCVFTTYIYANVDTCSQTYADLTAQALVNLPDSATFNSDSLLPQGTSYIWSFGDGVTDSGVNYYYGTTYAYNEITAAHFYQAPGSYFICLTVQIPGCGATQACNYANVGCNLDAAFGYSLLNGNTIAYYPNLPNDMPTDPNVAYHWEFGDGAVSSEVYPTHVYADTGLYNTCLVVTDGVFGCSDTLCEQVVYSPWTDTICGTVFIDNNGNGIMDSGDAGLPNVLLNVYAGSASIQVVTDANGNYMTLVPANTFLIIDNNFPPNTPFSLPFFYNNYTFQFSNSNQRQCGFDFGVLQGFVGIAGTVYGDDNHNGLMDNGELGIPNQLVDIGNQQQIVTLSNGMYIAYVDTGNYVIQKDPSGYFAANTTLPVNIPMYIPNYSVVDTGLNLGVQTTQGIHDVAIDLVPLTPVTAGGIPVYAIEITNLTSQTENFYDSMTNDLSLPFDFNYSLYSSLDAGTNTSLWTNFGTGGFATYTQFAGCDGSVSLVLNQDLYSSAAVGISGNTDNNPANNTDSCHQIVVGPYDPNNKNSNQPGKTAMGYISTGQVLKYAIEFENTGNSNAVNVIVRDVLDPGFDLKTFRFIASSYGACDVHLLGDTVYFRFSDIMLPPNSVNPSQSVGWVSYSIQPKPTLAPLTQLHNNANIYFDHNAPIVTNTTLHTIEGPTSIQSIYEDGELWMAPNPFSKQISFRLQNMAAAQYSYTVTDVLGRTVTQGITVTGQTTTLNRSGMSAGTYLITFFNSDGIVKRAKIVAE